MNPQLLLQDSPSFRRTVVMMVLIAILLFDWQPDSRLLSTPAQRREEDRPLPEDGSEVGSQAARPLRSAHLEAVARPLPGGRQAARRRPGRRG
ncbi:hypothetical protein F0U60_48325 [Archangium minus]|uniref:Uncharacterized protein n=1 Tax=Archangium minus TaxID=83450 RepID=A0ABY9X6R0_9BACT|nr:hypothetical protein F0U61_48360 [Archangium violaceum]WNG51077.1 hypothetical protein F0U60_48325 [Archangium minus]